MAIKQRITPFLWYDTEAKDAADLYVSIFPNSKITGLSHYGESGPGPKGSVMTVGFELDGLKFTALNAGPMFKFTEAISMVINCETQAEIDHYWSKLTADGGAESMCGWLKDKYGLSWQVVPAILPELMTGSPAKANAVMTALLKMRKLDLPTLKAAGEAA